MILTKVNPAELVPLDIFTLNYPIAIDLVYSQKNHPENIFGKIYRESARMWLHVDLAAVLVLASRICHKGAGSAVLQAKDGLRTIEAQTLMQRSEIVRKNPHWCEEPNRLLSPPGRGAHPKAMAIDVTVLDKNGDPLEMGTPFDYLDGDPQKNPAARNFEDLPKSVLKNRKMLEECMLESAQLLEIPLLPLPSEWWDFRMPPQITKTYGPLSDNDLPAQMHMADNSGPFFSSYPEFPDSHFERLKSQIEDRIFAACR
jgi:D-alanyl-D-alanine dipeptidase